MERKTYFSIGELIGYLILIIVGLNLLIAIPVVIKLYPVILENIEMPDMYGTSEYIVQEDGILLFEFTLNGSIKAKYEVYTYSSLLLPSISEETINNTNVEQKVGSLKTISFLY